MSTMHYFAYGSNINLEHLRDWLSGAGVDFSEVGIVRRALLSGRKLRTNYRSQTHGAGASNIEPSNGHIVEGLLMEISEKVREALRHKEGFYVRRYDEHWVEVELLDGSDAIRALTYVVCEERREASDLPVSEAYRQCILKGAEEAALSDNCQNHLRTVLRTSSNEGIAAGGGGA